MLTDYTQEQQKKSPIHAYIASLYIQRFDVQTIRDILCELPQVISKKKSLRVLNGPDGIYCKVHADGVFRLSIDTIFYNKHPQSQSTFALTKYTCIDLSGQMPVYKIGKPLTREHTTQKIFTPIFSYNITKKRIYLQSYGVCPNIEYLANPQPEDIELIRGTRLI
jgi:hypothetical protein